MPLHQIIWYNKPIQTKRVVIKPASGFRKAIFPLRYFLALLRRFSSFLYGIIETYLCRQFVLFGQWPKKICRKIFSVWYQKKYCITFSGHRRGLLSPRCRKPIFVRQINNVTRYGSWQYFEILFFMFASDNLHGILKPVTSWLILHAYVLELKASSCCFILVEPKVQSMQAKEPPSGLQ